MKAITSTWFECQVSVPKTQDDGSVKVANEVYTVDALTFTEAESRITDEMQPYVANMVGGFNIKNINPAQYKEVFFSEKKDDDTPAINKDDSRVGMRAYARGRAYDPNRYPVTPYHDPNVKAEPAPEVVELTEEEKTILAEENPALLESAVAVETVVEETVVEETVVAEETASEGDYEAPYAEDEEETTNYRSEHSC